MTTTTSIQTPVALSTPTVLPEWIDHNGHMNVAYYLLNFDQASDVLNNYIGLTREYKNESQTATFIGGVNITYKREVREGDPLRLTGRIVGVDPKRVHYWLEMHHGTEGYLAAVAEIVKLHIDMTTRRVTPMPDDKRRRIEDIRDAHAALGTPKDLGRALKTK